MNEQLICPASQIAGRSIDINNQGGKIKLPEERCHEAIYACIDCPFKRQRLCVGIIDVPKREIRCIPYGDEIPEKRKIFDKYRITLYEAVANALEFIYMKMQDSTDHQILYGERLDLLDIDELDPSPSPN